MMEEAIDWEIAFLDGSSKVVEANGFQIQGDTMVFIKVSPIRGPGGQVSPDPVLIVNRSAIKYAEPIEKRVLA